MEEKNKPKKTPKKKSPVWKGGISKRGRRMTSPKKAGEKANVEKCLSLIIREETETEREEREAWEYTEMLDRLRWKFKIEKKMWRPTVMTEEVLSKLLTAYAIGANDEEASSYAGIHVNSYYRHIEKYPDFWELVDIMKVRLPLKARMTLDKAIGDVKNAKLAFFYLRDRYPREFSKNLGFVKDPDSEANRWGTVVNMIFAPNLWRSQFFKPEGLDETKNPL